MNILISTLAVVSIPIKTIGKNQTDVDDAINRQPLSKRATDLIKEQQLWQQEIRDTRYAGPYPN